MTERGSTRHGARVDDELKSESKSLRRGAPVEPRVQPWRQMEPAAEGEPEPDAFPSRTEIEDRSLLAASLRPSAFPGDRARLVEMAEAEHASDEIMSWLGRLPAGVRFANVQQVWDALGGKHEQRESARAAANRVSTQPLVSPVNADAGPDRGLDESSHDQSLLDLGQSIATELAELMLGAAALVVGGVYQSIRAVARRLTCSSSSG